MFGDGITPVALTFAVLDLTGSGTDLGLVLAAQSIPLVLLALVGGVWADRLPRAALMMTSDLVRAAVQITGAVLLLTGTAQIWQLAVLAACHGAAEAFFRPAAGAILPQIVPAGELQQANALMGMSDNFGWMVGPAVAGVLVAVIGPGGAIAIDGATFLVSAAFLARLHVPAITQAEAAVHGFFAELRAGWQEVKSRTWLWVMLLRVCLVLCIVIAPFQILGPLGLREEGYGAVAWGWLQAVFSAGMIVGMAIAMRYRPKRPMITVTLTGSTAAAAPLALAIFGEPVGARRGLRPARRRRGHPRRGVEHDPADADRQGVAGPRHGVGLDVVARPVAAGPGGRRPSRRTLRRDHHVLGHRHPRAAGGLLGAARQGRVAAAAGDGPDRRTCPAGAAGRRRRAPHERVVEAAVTQRQRRRGPAAAPPSPQVECCSLRPRRPPA